MVVIKDPTRVQDLNRLEAQASNSKGSRESLEKVYAQSKDHKLTEMRQALVQAHTTANHEQVARMEQVIREHSERTYGR